MPPNSSLQLKLSKAIAEIVSVQRLLKEGGEKNAARARRGLSKAIALLKEIKAANRCCEPERLRVLVQVAQVINSSLDLETVLQHVIDSVFLLTRAERAFLMLKDESGHLKTVIARNWTKESIDKADLAISRTVINRTLSTNKPVLTLNALEDQRFKEQKSILRHNLRSILCVPIVIQGKSIGALYVDNRAQSGAFTRQDQEVLSALANQAAIALENARLFASLRRSFQDLSELKNLLNNVFSSIDRGIIDVDEQGNVALLNPAAYRILKALGVSADKVTESLFAEHVCPLSSQLERYLVEVRREGKQITGLEFPILSNQGEKLFLEVSIFPLKAQKKRTRSVVILIADVTEKRRLEFTRRLLERMVSPQVIAHLERVGLQKEGHSTTISVLFADLRGFTALSERISPDQLVTILNRYLEVGVRALLKHGGTIDKFIGDAILAWFNAPIPQPDHALRAVRVAFEIHRLVRETNKTLPKEHRLNFGIGIHLGEAVLGLVGTEQRLEYTAVGDSVNTAERIQEIAQAGQTLISEAVYEKVRPWVEVREVPVREFRGKQQQIKLYEVLRVTQ